MITAWIVAGVVIVVLLYKLARHEERLDMHNIRLQLLEEDENKRYEEKHGVSLGSDGDFDYEPKEEGTHAEISS